MQLRHRAPTIFSIYMVDVLCCALGCVVLLWQYNLNEAQETAAKEREALASLNLSTDAKRKLEAQLAEQLSKNVNLTASNSALMKELEDKKSKYLLLAFERDTAEAEIKNLTLVHKKELEAARAAEAFAKKAGEDLEKVAEALRLANKNLTQTVSDIKKDKELDLARLTENAALIIELNKKIQTMTLVHKKDLDDAKNAEALAKKAGEELTRLLDALKIDHKNLTQTASDFKKGKETDLARLAENATIIIELNKKIQEAEQTLAGLRKDVLKWKTTADEAGIKVGETKLTLQDALTRNRKLETQMEQLLIDLKQGKVRADLLDQENARIRTELAATRTELAESKKLNQDLAKRFQSLNLDFEVQRAGRNKDLENLKLEHLAKLEWLQAVNKNRFAGITLTGSRVIFMVDMSGSMIYVDENTLDPDKWPTLCETVGKLMMSLPDLKQYQVILFSTGVSFPLGKEGSWLDYDPNKSVDFTVKRLKAVKPAGGTNIHGAFAEVFKYREQGLDTVYFFSDGLANIGEGLPTDPEAVVKVAGNAIAVKKLTEQQKGEILGNHVRRVLKTNWNRPMPKSPRVRINTIGFFYESPDVGAFLWALAREHDGSFVGMSKP